MQVNNSIHIRFLIGFYLDSQMIYQQQMLFSSVIFTIAASEFGILQK